MCWPYRLQSRNSSKRSLPKTTSLKRSASFPLSLFQPYNRANMPQLNNPVSSFSCSVPSLRRHLLRKKPRLGFRSLVSRPDRRKSLANALNASEMRECLYDFCRRTRNTTYQRDSESNLDYAGARYLANNYGRFVSSDPGPMNPAQPISLNRYVYVGNDPVNFHDPTGRSFCPAEYSYAMRRRCWILGRGFRRRRRGVIALDVWDVAGKLARCSVRNEDIR